VPSDPAVDWEVRVLYVDHARALGGAEFSLLELLRHLPGGVIPALATRAGALADEAMALGVPVFEVPMARLRSAATAPWQLTRGAIALHRAARAWSADVVHANVLRAAIYTAAAPAATGRLVWHVRDIHEPGVTPRWLCRRAAGVVANSRASAAALPCAARVRVVPNPVSPPRAHGMSREQLGLPTAGASSGGRYPSATPSAPGRAPPPLVAHVARLRPWKGQADFLRIAAAVRDPDVRFLIVGGRVFDDEETRAYEPALRNMAVDLGVADRVTFTGQRGDLGEIWPHVAVMVHTSRAEPFGRTVAEAQAAGVPVVAYGDGGIPEIVTDGVTGVLVAPGEVTAAARAVEALLADPARRSEMGAAARRAAGRFAPERHAEALTAIYREIAAGANR
jgi:glycosyltransferase involved in cell wall biosynthesis